MSRPWTQIEEDAVSYVPVNSLASEFFAVPEAEIGFALTLFVGAASGRLGSVGERESSLESSQRRVRLLGVLSAGRTRMATHHEPRVLSLDYAFMALWKHYDGSMLQASVCARVLGFYYLMEESEGAAIERWMSPCEETEETVVLHPMVVETLAEVPLGNDGLMEARVFLAALEAQPMRV